MQFQYFHSDDALHSWSAWFLRVWPTYQQWYCRDGLEQRPSLPICHSAIKHYLPQYLPLWERLIAAVGGGDIEARFLSFFCPPAYSFACSQAIWQNGDSLLVRNYDYDPGLIDGVVLNSNWQGTRVLGSSDCLAGLVDGINEHGLCVSLTFGGSREVGIGFAMPIILRYALQFYTEVDSAAAFIAKTPSHVAYNVTLLDATGNFSTIHVTPGREGVITKHPVATNHQPDVAAIDAIGQMATFERERFLLRQLTTHCDEAEQFIAHFLQPPLYSFAFAQRRGTLFTATYRPQQRQLRYLWPGYAWDFNFDDLTPRSIEIQFPQ